VQTEEIIMSDAGLQPPRAPKVFFVEDDKDIVDIYKEALVHEGFSVESAEDGLRAIKLVKQIKPDVIVLDLLMPKLNGVDVVKYVRAHADTAKIPIIILSNAFMSDLVQRAADAGANLGLLKSSCTPNKLIGVINSVLIGDQCDTQHMSLLAAPLRDKRDGTNAFLRSEVELPKVEPPSLLDQVSEPKRSPSTEMRHAFTVTEARTIEDMKSLWQGVLMHESASAREISMTEIYKKLSKVTASATAASCTYIARFSKALEALLRDLLDEPNNISYARLLAVAEGIDFLKYLFNITGGVNFGSPNPNTVMLIDPDIEFSFSMEREFANFNLRLIQATDTATASLILEREPFDLLLVEADLPDLSGFTFCVRTRANQSFAKTPIMFLTSNLTADTRPRAVLSGGKEVFGKPLLASEVITKVLMQVMRDEIDAAKPQ
jgi:DNA-binding response OmpR family regulator